MDNGTRLRKKFEEIFSTSGLELLATNKLCSHYTV